MKFYPPVHYCLGGSAAKDFWEHTYNGRAAEALWTHIRSHYDPNGDRIYVHFCSVIQSSGMGKSRSVTNNTCTRIFPGYPPADQEVRDFLTTEHTEDELYRWACCFINALFQHIDHTLNSVFDLGWRIEKVARKFGILMMAGQTMKQHNEFRRQFYQQVVRIADGKLIAQNVCLP